MILLAVVAIGSAGHPIGIGLEAVTSNRYLRRGFVRCDSPVGQASAELSIYGVEAAFWTNMPLVSRRIDELVPSLGYRFQYGGLDLNARVCYYHYPPALKSNTAEVTLAVLYAAGPGIAHTYHALDVVQAAGAYYGNAGLDLLWPVLPILFAGPGVNVGWASAKFNLAHAGPDISSLLHISGSAAIICRLLPGIELGLHGTVNHLLPAEIRRAQGRNATNWNAGARLQLKL